MYAKIENGTVVEFPYNKYKIKGDNPNTSFPKEISNDLLLSYGIHQVTREAFPDIDDRTHIVMPKENPELVDGQWVLKWEVTARTAEQIAEYDAGAALSLRQERDAKLAETDWWASSDLTMTAEQTAYRQALRDITSHANWPYLEEADWPTKP